MNYKLLENTILLFWDESTNFAQSTTQQKIGKDLFKGVFLIDSLQKLKEILDQTKDDNQKFIFFIHLFHNDENKGYFSFKFSKISKEYPNLVTYLISSAPKRTIYATGNHELDVYSYDNFHEKIGTTFQPQTKSEITNKVSIEEEQTISHGGYNNAYPQIDFAIITALYKDEFQEVEKLFDWDERLDVNTETKKYRVGHLKNFPEKKIVAAVPSATGMVDSAIIATQMLDYFQPKFLIMSGVCGGKPSFNFGDIVLAKKIFTFQKGKVSDLRNEEGKKIELYDIDKNKVDYDHLYDENGNQLKVNIEKFEIEHDSIIEIDPLLGDTIEPKLEGIESSINEYLKPFSKSITIHFDAMACSTMVINRDGFFEDNIKVVDRKTVAVEMESYGVARACRFANNGRTKFVIFKSVMDNMTKKDDDAKKFAAHTSAQFLKHLLYDNILK